MYYIDKLSIPDFYPITEGNFIIKNEDGRTLNLRLLKITHNPYIYWFDDMRTGKYYKIEKDVFDKLIIHRKL